MLIVPDLAENGVASVGCVLASLGGVEPGSRATQERDTAVLLMKDVYEFGVRVSGGVGRCDAFCREPVESWEVLVVLDCCLEEVNDILVLAVLGPIARNVKCGKASGVL